MSNGSTFEIRYSFTKLSGILVLSRPSPRPVSMNSENKREQQNKRKQTSTQPKQHVICNGKTFMRHIVIVAHCGDVILCFQFYF